MLAPDWFPVGDFRMTLDYFDIEITDAIAGLGAQFFINACYNSLGADAAACARVVRDPVDGQIDFVNASIANLNSLQSEGVDLQVEWSVNLEDTFIPLPGRLRINELFSYIDNFAINGTDFSGTTSGAIGGANFDWKSTLSIYYNLGDWTAFARWSYVPELCDISFQDPTMKNCAPGSFGVMNPEASYVDASVRWAVTDNFQVTGFIGNLFDEAPPQTVGGSQGNTDPVLYRVLGRTFSVSAKLRF